ncbi:hypothetical protein [Bradyrhizobium sp. USDA 4353]
MSSADVAPTRQLPTRVARDRLLQLPGILMLLLLAGCASAAAPSPQADAGQPAAASNDTSKRDSRAVAASTAADPSLPRRREAIARVLEDHLGYRTWLDDGAPRLSEAKFSGPFEYGGGPFESKRITIYCVSAKLELPLIPTTRITVVHFEPGEGGREKMEFVVAMNHTPKGCMLAKYEPFPELERAREQRRQKMGKPA